MLSSRRAVVDRHGRGRALRLRAARLFCEQPELAVVPLGQVQRVTGELVLEGDVPGGQPLRSNAVVPAGDDAHRRLLVAGGCLQGRLRGTVEAGCVDVGPGVVLAHLERDVAASAGLGGDLDERGCLVGRRGSGTGLGDRRQQVRGQRRDRLRVRRGRAAAARPRVVADEQRPDQSCRDEHQEQQEDEDPSKRPRPPRRAAPAARCPSRRLGLRHTDDCPRRREVIAARPGPSRPSCPRAGCGDSAAAAPSRS